MVAKSRHEAAIKKLRNRLKDSLDKKNIKGLIEMALACDLEVPKILLEESE